MRALPALGDTDDPAALIPGRPGRLRRVAAGYGALRDILDASAEALREVSGQVGRWGWDGASADAFAEQLTRATRHWRHLAEDYDTVREATDAQAESVAWGQRRARDAVALYHGDPRDHTRARDRDRDREDTDSDEEGGPGHRRSGPDRQRAQQLLADTRARLAEVADTATGQIEATTATGWADPRGAGRTGPIVVHPPLGSDRDHSLELPVYDPTDRERDTEPDDGWRPLSAPTHPAAADPTPTDAATDPTPAHAANAGPVPPTPHPPAPVPPGGADPGWLASLPDSDPRHHRHTVVAPPDADGAHDNLYRIAQRELGDGNRWPQIWGLNHNLPQPDGSRVLIPSLVRPGQILALPTDTPPDPVDGCPPPGSDPTQPASSASAPPPAGTAGPVRTHDPGGGWHLPVGLGALGLAGIGIAIATGRGHPSRRPTRGGEQPHHTPATPPDPAGTDSASGWEPRTGHDPTDPASPPTPPDSALHTPASGPAGTDGPPAPTRRTTAAAAAGVCPPPRGGDSGTPSDPDTHHDDWHPLTPPPHPTTAPPTAARATPASATPAAITPASTTPVSVTPASASVPGGHHSPPPAAGPEMSALRVPVMAGVRGGHAVLVDLAALGGLGLTGPATLLAARGLLVALSHAHRPQGDPPATHTVIMTRAVAEQLFGEPLDTHQPPAGIRLADDLDTALDELELAIVRRARLAQHDPAMTHPPLVLFTEPDPEHTTRLRTVLELAAPLGIAAVLTAAWPAGTTCHLAPDATITCATGPAADTLRTTRLFTAPATDFGELLTTDPPLTPTTAPPPDTPDTTADTADPGAAAGAARVAASPPGRLPGPPDEALLVIRCFGRLRVHTRNRPGAPLGEVSTLSPKHRLLLGCLVCRRDGVPPDMLLEAGWPEVPYKAALGRRDATLTALRRVLREATDHPDAGYATLAAGRYHLTDPQADPPAAWVDYWAFGEAITTARAHPDHDHQRVRALQQATRLYTSPLLEDDDSLPAAAARQAAHQDALHALDSLAEHYEHTHPGRATALLETAFGHDPGHSPTVGHLIRHHHHHGRPDAALRVYTRHTSHLAEHGLEPDPALTAALRHPPHTHPLPPTRPTTPARPHRDAG